MQFSCKSSLFRKGVLDVQNVAQSKIANPIIENILVIAEEEQVLFIGTNLTQTIRCRVDAAVEKEGQIAVPGKYMGNLARELGEGIVSVALKRNRLVVNCAKSEYRLGAIPAEEFPPFLPLREGESVCFTTAEIRAVIQKTVFATSSEKARFELDGVKVEGSGNEIRFVATDGRRLSFVRLKREKELSREVKALVPTRTWQELARVLPEGDAVQVIFGESKVMFEAGQVTLLSSLLGDNFPPYDQIIPKGFSKQLRLDRHRLESAVRRACVLASESTNQIMLDISKGEVVIHGESRTLGEAKDVIKGEYEGDPMRVSYKGDYVIDFLKSATTEKIVLEINNETSPAGCRELDNEDYLHIIMPLKIQEETATDEEEQE